MYSQDLLLSIVYLTLCYMASIMENSTLTYLIYGFT